MDHKGGFLFMFLFALIGTVFGYGIGSLNSTIAIEQCEKELPRNVNCKIIAVPVDKN